MCLRRGNICLSSWFWSCRSMNNQLHGFETVAEQDDMVNMWRRKLFDLKTRNQRKKKEQESHYPLKGYSPQWYKPLSDSQFPKVLPSHNRAKVWRNQSFNSWAFWIHQPNYSKETERCLPPYELLITTLPRDLPNLRASQLLLLGNTQLYKEHRKRRQLFNIVLGEVAKTGIGHFRNNNLPKPSTPEKREEMREAWCLWWLKDTFQR